MILPPWGWAAFGAGLGAIAGSYIATIVIRWPQGIAANGRSRCDSCGRTLAAHDLVPLLSFAWARGRCGACGTWIDRRHPAIEAAAAAIGLVSLLAVPGPAGLAGALFGWLLLALALLDQAHFWLPDRLTATLALAGLGMGLAGLPPPLADRLAGGAAGWLALAGIAFAYARVRGREGLGAGDAKLFGAIGLWLGWRALPLVLLGASLAGIVALIALAAAGRPVSATMRVPFGALLALAGWGYWLADRGFDLFP